MPAVRTSVRHRVRPLTSAVQAALPQSQSQPRILANDPRVEYRPIGDLKSHPRQTKKHSRQKIERLKASISKFGFNSIIGIDQAGTIVTGHACVIAAKELGHTHIRALCIDHLNELELRAFMLAHNKLSEGSEVDLETLKVELLETAEVVEYDFSVLGFDAAEVDVILHGDDETASADDAENEALPALRTVAVTRVGDLWGVGAGRFLCGDALDPASYARLMGEERAHVIILDPPYNCKVQGHVSGQGRHQHREFAMASGEMTPAVHRLSQTLHPPRHALRRRLAHYLFMDHRHMGEILTAGDAVYDSRLNLLVWKKTAGGMGSFYRSQHELIFLYKNGREPHINNVRLAPTGVTGPMSSRSLARIPSVPVATKNWPGIHPKPVKFIADLIRDASKLNDWVLDSFVGGGTVFIAAEQTHRRAVGIEIRPSCIAISRSNAGRNSPANPRFWLRPARRLPRWPPSGWGIRL